LAQAYAKKALAPPPSMPYIMPCLRIMRQHWNPREIILNYRLN